MGPARKGTSQIDSPPPPKRHIQSLARSAILENSTTKELLKLPVVFSFMLVCLFFLN